MNSDMELALDTSVLFNFVYSNLPGDIEEDRGCQRLINARDYFCVIGPKASGEFDACCDRRLDLYDDLLDWLAENPEESIYEYDPTRRDVRTSSNDIDHLRLEVQHGWASDPRRKQLSDLRRCKQDLANFQELVPDELLDEVYEQLADNDDLATALAGLDLDHDVEIIVDAVEICREDSINTLVAVDSDITGDGQIEAVNEAIQEVDGGGLTLDIMEAQSV